MKKDMSNMLRQRSLKVTPLRLAIIKLFNDCKKPQDVEAIKEKIKGSDEVSIYRTLNSFSKVGLIQRVDLRKKSVFYELSLSHHHHIVCHTCGLIEDFKTCMAENLLKPILSHSSKFATLSDHSFELFGICNACNRS